LETAPTSALVITLVGLLIIIAFSSGTEVAMLAVNRYRIRTRAAAGERRAHALEKLLAKPDQWLGATLVIQELASGGAFTLATLLALRLLHPEAVLVVTLSLAVFIITFCELAPKIYAAMHSESVALHSTRVYRVLLLVTWLPRWFANHAAYGFLRLFGLRSAAHSAQALSTEELRTAVSESSALIPARNRQMLLSILDLERVTVNDIMIPRQEIAGIDVSWDWEDVLERLRQTPHTRLPVYDGELDNIIGILHMKRTAQEFSRGTFTRERLIELAAARVPYFVPSGPSLMQQLAQFQRNRRRHAFVVDEYGDIEGLVTLEDLLEEIVGEFTTDPATVGHKDVHRDASGAWLINGSATIRALNRSLGWHLPDLGPKTLNGLLLEKFENIPQAGTSLRIGDLEFEVMQTVDNQVRTVRVRPIAAALDQDAAD
jgi:Mg2+/Co2+ transporter CorB